MGLCGARRWLFVLLLLWWRRTFFFFFLGGGPGRGDLERRWGRIPSGQHGKVSWVSAIMELSFFPRPSFLSSSSGGELTKSKITSGKFDILAFRFSIATISQA